MKAAPSVDALFLIAAINAQRGVNEQRCINNTFRLAVVEATGDAGETAVIYFYCF